MKGFFNITYATAHQACREPIYYILTGIFALLVYASQYFVLFVFQGEEAVVMETGVASISACGFLLALLLSWLLIRKEMEQMSILTVLSKPVSRFSFISGKYAGLLVALLLSTFFLFLMFCLNLWQFDGHRILDTVEERMSSEFMQELEDKRSERLSEGTGKSEGQGQNQADRLDPDDMPSRLWIDLKGGYTGLERFFNKWIVPGVISTMPAFLSIAIVLSICSVCSVFFEILPTAGFTIVFLILGSLSGSLFEVLAMSGEPGVLNQVFGWLIHVLIPDLFRLNIASSVGSRLHMDASGLIWYFYSFLGYALISTVFFVCFVLTAGTVFFQRKEIT